MTIFEMNFLAIFPDQRYDKCIIIWLIGMRYSAQKDMYLHKNRCLGEPKSIAKK